jgi:hypothetical protein
VDDVPESEFKQAIEAFFQHLKSAGYAKTLRIMRRKPLELFGVRLPDFT